MTLLSTHKTPPKEPLAPQKLEPITKPAVEKIVQVPPTDPVKQETLATTTVKPAGGEDTLKDEKPIVSGLPEASKNTPVRFTHAAKPETMLKVTVNAASGSGSPAPDKTLTGKNGAASPETPLEDTVYTGGGAGGQNFPKAPAKIGGGGGSAILSVNNPLAKEVIPEDKPGLGPGTGGAAGIGSGGGIGFRAGKGIGTRREGRDALATLNSKPGKGIGAGQGSNIGTNAPGGGKGSG